MRSCPSCAGRGRLDAQRSGAARESGSRERRASEAGSRSSAANGTSAHAANGRHRSSSRAGGGVRAEAYTGIGAGAEEEEEWGEDDEEWDEEEQPLASRAARLTIKGKKQGRGGRKPDPGQCLHCKDEGHRWVLRPSPLLPSAFSFSEFWCLNEQRHQACQRNSSVQ